VWRQVAADFGEAVMGLGAPRVFPAWFDQPRASLSLSANIHLNVLNNSYDLMYF
jgi:hypothetical protein